MSGDLPRNVPPLPDRPYVGPTMYEATDPQAKYMTIEPVRPPEAAPNVWLVGLHPNGRAIDENA
jgi:hypothetical protein